MGAKGCAPAAKATLPTHRTQEIPSPGHPTLLKSTFLPTQVCPLPHQASSCPVGAHETFSAGSNCLYGHVGLSIPLQSLAALGIQSLGTSMGLAGTSAVPGRPPSSSRTFGGRAALQPGMSQTQLTPVSRSLGISSVLFPLKRLHRSRLACLCGLTGAIHRDRGTPRGPSPHPVSPEHPHQ